LEFSINCASLLRYNRNFSDDIKISDLASKLFYEQNNPQKKIKKKKREVKLWFLEKEKFLFIEDGNPVVSEQFWTVKSEEQRGRKRLAASTHVPLPSTFENERTSNRYPQHLKMRELQTVWRSRLFCKRSHDFKASERRGGVTKKPSQIWVRTWSFGF